MPTFTRTVPKDAAELFGFLVELHDNQTHVVSIEANANDSRVEIDLSRTANTFGGYPDVFLPIRRGQIELAQTVVARIRRQSELGFAPTTMDAEALFQLIDPSPR